MKILFIVCALLLLAGCSEGFNWPVFSQGLHDYSIQQQNLAHQQQMQAYRNAEIINQQIRNNNYWQEQKAEQEYWQNYRRQGLSIYP